VQTRRKQEAFEKRRILTSDPYFDVKAMFDRALQIQEEEEEGEEDIFSSLSIITNGRCRDGWIRSMA
jgi:hypothetical protein